ncbi:hypothetical protein FSP39_020436 [Pinctada imbricata]|uniref:Sodium-dependent glucose transporter 1 n=1 Tax=Pinctada imbricata TaxID=66713 RepID=A0AA88YRE2_PINIB|nr:hypothetical protein FSP39_020436 [Pinctada imbricata]
MEVTEESTGMMFDFYDPSMESETEALLKDTNVDKELLYDTKMRRGPKVSDKRQDQDEDYYTYKNRRTGEMGQRGETFRKVLVTICLIGVWVAMGLFMEIAGPTLKDFKLRLHTTTESISNAVSGRSVGKFVGVFLGGFFVDKFGSLCNFVLGFALSMAAVTTVCLPWVTSTDVLWFMYLLLGTSLGLINIAGQRIVLAVWLEKSASPMHIVHLGYGVGGFIAPLLVNPFLADLPDDEISSTVSPSTLRYDEMTTVHYENSSSSNVDVVSNIEYAYSIVAIITAGFALIFFLYQIAACRNSFRGSKTDAMEKSKDPDKKEDILLKKRSFLQMINPATCAEGSFCFGFLVLVLLFLRFFFLTGVDREVGTFLYSYAVDQLHFSKDDATYVNTIFWINYAVGRFVAFVVAFWVSVKIILVVETILAVATGVAMVTFALDQPLALWIISGCIGFLLGPMFPTGIAWGDVYIEMTGLAITWTLLGSAFGGLTYLRLGGFAYDKYGPTSFPYIFLGTVIIVAVFDFILTFLGLCKRRITGKSGENKEEMPVSSPDVQVQIEGLDSKKDS